MLNQKKHTQTQTIIIKQRCWVKLCWQKGAQYYTPDGPGRGLTGLRPLTVIIDENHNNDNTYIDYIYSAKKKKNTYIEQIFNQSETSQQ